MIKKILIVDDEVETLRLISIALRRQGMQVITANNGSQALELAFSEKPNLIILDIMMPDINGFEVVKRLKKNAKTEDIPVLIFSARNQSSDKVTGYESGADDYLTKPIHPAELISHVKTLLEKSPVILPEEHPSNYAVAVIGAAGGVGTSTVMVNLACMSAQQLHSREIMGVEMTPGHGSFRSFYGGAEDKQILEDFLKMPINEITPDLIDPEVIRMSYGPRILTAGDSLNNNRYYEQHDHALKVMQQVNKMAPLAFFDFGSMHWSNYDTLLEWCNEVIVVSSPLPSIIVKTRKLVNELANYEFDTVKPLNIISISRGRSTIALTLNEMEEAIHHSVAHIIPASPEQAYQAEAGHKPIGLIRTNNIVTQQLNNATNKLLNRYNEFAETERQS
jgi:CheY-like chemotaxis protein/MinD-like ATPase involved in chromosome partitioning or flagellar assembly